MQSLKLLFIIFLITCSSFCIAQTNQLDPIYGLYDEENILYDTLDPNTKSSSFQYQGMLLEHSIPAYGNYDLIFILYDTPNDVNIVSSAIIIEDVNVIDGHYKVELDFGSNAFDGNPRWLEIWNKPTGSDDSLYIISPREKLLPVPYALHSNNGTSEISSRNTLEAADGDPVDAVYVDDKGKVGIGTNSPSEKLDIFGTVKMSGFKMTSGSSEGYVLTSNNSGTGTWQPLPSLSSVFSGSGTTNYFPKFMSSSSLGNSILFQSPSGNIGIDKNNPSEKLDVAGTVKMSGFQMTNGASGGYVLMSDSSGYGIWQPFPNISSGLTGSGSTNRLSKFTDSDTLGNSSIYETFGGSIGIGTINPGAKLEVRGGPIKATDGLIIETRTSDPSNPVTGQIWLRTDL